MFVDKAAPPEVKRGVPARRGARLQPVRHVRAGRHGQLAGMHPDLSRRRLAAMPLNNQMGSGTTALIAALGAWASDSGFSESNHRQFYRPLGRADGRRTLGRRAVHATDGAGAGHAGMNEDVIREVEQFLYREARLLDERRFHDWLELLTDDVRYWMARAQQPLSEDQQGDRDPRSRPLRRGGSDQGETSWRSSTRTRRASPAASRGSTPAWPGPRTRRRARAI